MDLRSSFPDNSSNFSDYGEHQTEACDTSYIYSDWIFTVVPVYIYVIAALGILFNLVVLLVFLLHKKACTVAEIYLSNMAAADFLLVLFLPFWAVYASSEFRWPFGDHMCRIVPLSIVINSNCSIYFLVLVCIDRYLALVHPLSQSKLRRRKYAKLNCLLVWIFGLLLGIPTLVCRQVKEHNDTIQYNETFEYDIIEYTCNLNCDMNVYLANEVIQTIVPFMIPTCIISFCTFKIIQALKKRPLAVSSTHKNEHKATILVLVVLLAFLVCWLPFHIVRLIELFVRFEVIKHDCTLLKNIYICKNLFTYFAYFNSDLNPVLYVIVGKNFRKNMLDVFTRYGSKRKSSTQLTTMTSSNLFLSHKVSANEVI